MPGDCQIREQAFSGGRVFIQDRLCIAAWIEAQLCTKNVEFTYEKCRFQQNSERSPAKLKEHDVFEDLRQSAFLH